MRITSGLITAICVTLLFVACKKDETSGSDKCKGITCLNGGTCENGSCKCQLGYEGADCGILSRAKVIGTYNGYIVSSGDKDSVFCTVTVSEHTDKTKVNVSGLKIKSPAGKSVPTVICTMEDTTHFGISEGLYQLRCSYNNASKELNISYVEDASIYIHRFDGSK